MTDQALQIIARGPRAQAEAAAQAIDADPALEAATYSILEEDEDRGVWRIDAFPTTDEEAQGLAALAQPIRGALKPGGVAILSGLLRSQERRVFAAYRSRGFRMVRRLHRDAWAALVLQRA